MCDETLPLRICLCNPQDTIKFLVKSRSRIGTTKYYKTNPTVEQRNGRVQQQNIEESYGRVLFSARLNVNNLENREGYTSLLEIDEFEIKLYFWLSSCTYKAHLSTKLFIYLHDIHNNKLQLNSLFLLWDKIPFETPPPIHYLQLFYGVIGSSI